MAHNEGSPNHQDYNLSSKKTFFTLGSSGTRNQALIPSMSHDNSELRNLNAQSSKLGQPLGGFNNPLLSKQIILGQKSAQQPVSPGLGNASFSNMQNTKLFATTAASLGLGEGTRQEAEKTGSVSNLERSQKLLERLEGISHRRQDGTDTQGQRITSIRSGAQSVKAVRTQGSSNLLGDWSGPPAKNESSQPLPENHKPRGIDFLDGLDRLKQINSNAANSPDLGRPNQPRAMSAQARGLEDTESRKRSTQITIDDARQMLAAEATSQAGSTNRSHLDQKRKDLHGRLNDILDRLGSATSVKGETKSVAPALRGGLDAHNDDNLSLNSFHSSTPLTGGNQLLMQAATYSRQKGNTSTLQ